MTVVELLLFLFALLVAVAALVVALGARRSPVVGESAGSVDLPQDARALREEVAALRAEQAQALRHIAVVRYDAFEDTGGHLSWSIALLDDGGAGVLLTSIHGRNDARTYVKPVLAWSSEQALSPEETEAIGNARASAGSA